MIPTLFAISLISFFIIHLAPGKPTDLLADFNPKITPEAREKIEKLYNLDKPVIVQYGLWLEKIVRLDFGDSFSSDRRPVIRFQDVSQLDAKQLQVLNLPQRLRLRSPIAGFV